MRRGFPLLTLAKQRTSSLMRSWNWFRGTWIDPFTTGYPSERGKARTKPGGKWTPSFPVPTMGSSPKVQVARAAVPCPTEISRWVKQDENIF